MAASRRDDKTTFLKVAARLRALSLTLNRDGRAMAACALTNSSGSLAIANGMLDSGGAVVLLVLLQLAYLHCGMIKLSCIDLFFFFIIIEHCTIPSHYFIKPRTQTFTQTHCFNLRCLSTLLGSNCIVLRAQLGTLSVTDLTTEGSTFEPFFEFSFNINLF